MVSKPNRFVRYTEHFFHLKCRLKKTICQRIASLARLTFVELRSALKARMHCETFLSGNFMKCSFRAISWNMKYFHEILFYLKVGLYDEIFLSRPWNFYFESVEIFQEAKCVSWNIIQFVHAITFHSFDHDNVSFVERINNFHLSCYRYYSFKSCLKILKKHSQLCC